MITYEQFEEALKVCEAYQVQLQKQLTEVKQRIKGASVDKTNSKIINAATLRLTRDSKVSDLYNVHYPLYSVLSSYLGKDSLLSEMGEFTRKEVIGWRNIGSSKLDQLEQILDFIGVHFKENNDQSGNISRAKS